MSPLHTAVAAAAAQPALFNRIDLVPTLKPLGASVDPEIRKRTWLEFCQSLLSLHDTITSEWEIHHSWLKEFNLTRIDDEMIRARREAAELIFNMDKFLATAEGGIVASLMKLVAKGEAVKRSWELAIMSNGPPLLPSAAAAPVEEMCGLKKVRRKLDQVKMSRDMLLQELTLLTVKKMILEELVKLRKELLSGGRWELQPAMIKMVSDDILERLRGVAMENLS